MSKGSKCPKCVNGYIELYPTGRRQTCEHCGGTGLKRRPSNKPTRSYPVMFGSKRA